MRRKIEQILAQALYALQQAGTVPHDVNVLIKIDYTKDNAHGDYASNLALLLGKPCRQSPKKIAISLLEHIPEQTFIEKIDVAGAGFINFYIRPNARALIIDEILKQGDAFGCNQMKLAEASLVNANDDFIYPVQYAHARICIVLKQLIDRGLAFDRAVGLESVDLLIQPQEQHLIKVLGRYVDALELSALNGESHHLAYYLRELANGLHSYYNAVLLLCEEEPLRYARLCLLEAVKQVLCNGLKLLGISAPKSV